MEEWNNRKESKAKEWEARQFEPKTKLDQKQNRKASHGFVTLDRIILWSDSFV